MKRGKSFATSCCPANQNDWSNSTRMFSSSHVSLHIVMVRQQWTTDKLSVDAPTNTVKMCVCEVYDKNPIYDFFLFLELINFNFIIDRTELIYQAVHQLTFFETHHMANCLFLFFFSFFRNARL